MHPHMGGGISTNHYLQTEDISIRSRFIKLLSIWPDPTHWPSQLPAHQSMGGVVSTNYKSSNKIELSWFINLLVIWPDPTHQPTQPPTHQTMHPPIGGRFSTKFKSSNRIELSSLVQVLLNFDWFWGPPFKLCTHPWVGDSPQNSYLQTELNYLH